MARRLELQMEGIKLILNLVVFANSVLHVPYYSRFRPHRTGVRRPKGSGLAIVVRLGNICPQTPSSLHELFVVGQIGSRRAHPTPFARKTNILNEVTQRKFEIVNFAIYPKEQNSKMQNENKNLETLEHSKMFLGG